MESGAALTAGRRSRATLHVTDCKLYNNTSLWAGDARPLSVPPTPALSLFTTLPSLPLPLPLPGPEACFRAAREAGRGGCWVLRGAGSRWSRSGTQTTRAASLTLPLPRQPPLSLGSLIRLRQQCTQTRQHPQRAQGCRLNINALNTQRARNRKAAGDGEARAWGVLGAAGSRERRGELG